MTVLPPRPAHLLAVWSQRLRVRARIGHNDQRSRIALHCQQPADALSVTAPSTRSNSDVQ